VGPPAFGCASIAKAGRAGLRARAAVATMRDETEEAMHMSMLQSVSPLGEAMPGRALTADDLKRSRLYFESQAVTSDTCGMNALNNLCQRPQFKLENLQEAEAEHARAHDSHFADAKAAQMPTGFFDVEALKIAAKKSGLEVVDVEPVMDYRKSRCLDFADSARASEDGSWFLGFLVYDRRPGHPMHYYTLRRDERYPGVWLRLDSQLPQAEEESKNRQLTTEDLWALHQANSHHFGAWVLRWYPVIYCKGCAEEVCRQLARSQKPESAFSVTEECALKALKECGWVIPHTLTHLLEDLPRTTVRELLVRFARPSEAEMRSALEAADWDMAAAHPAIDKVLRQRIALCQAVDAGGFATTALSLCDWEPRQAATLLSLELQCNAAIIESGDESRRHALPVLHEALTIAGNDVDRAESLLSLVPEVGTMLQAASLLEQTKNWSVRVARRVLEVQKRFPRVSVIVVLEVLRRNDDDPHAACEMLAEYQKGVQRLVLENTTEDLIKDDEVLIAETALNCSDWDPSVAFVGAKNLTIAVEQTRKILRSHPRGFSQVFLVDSVLAALTAADQKPQAAAALLLGLPDQRPAGAPVPQNGQPIRPGGPAVRQDKRGQVTNEEEEYCSIM